MPQRRFEGTLDQLAEVRRFVRLTAGGHEAMRPAELVASELAANAVLHSDSGKPGGWFTVETRFAPKEVTVAVTDMGAEQEPAARTVGTDAVSGRGLWMVETLSLKWGCEPAGPGRRIWAVLDSSDRPLLFLDVDGPLIPFGAPVPHLGERSGDRTAPPPPPTGANPLLARIDPRHGARLSALPCDLVWATTWMADANEVISPLLGLPELPVVDWPDSDDEGPLHWKTRGLVGWAAGRPFVWVDDEITDADRAWVSAHHRGQALLHRVDPRCGLTHADFVTIADWLAQL